jgi:type IV pilus assembly protein PilB
MTKLPGQKKSKRLEVELEKKMQNIAIHDQEEAAETLANSLGLQFSNLSGVPIDPEALTVLPEDRSRTCGVAVIARKGKSIIAATLDPENPETKKVFEELKTRGFDVKILVTTSTALEKVLRRYETVKTADVFEIGAIDIQKKKLDELQSKIKNISDLKTQIHNVSTTDLLEILIAGALKIQASDIHFEPNPKETRLRYRLDGLLQDVTNIGNTYYSRLLNRVKVLSGLKLNIHKSPQDGRFTIRQKNVSIEVRVSVLPSEYGETIVMRLLDPRTIKAELEKLGMREDILAKVKEQLSKPHGALLTTGPTGSGKTTTLYAFVGHLNTADAKIITVEDPIEYHIQGISQTQVEPDKGYTFANGLRAIVRQDPDIILIGEIRDLETADIALNAALTGHLVLSTIHTNDAAGTIPRLIDLGVKPETIAPAISMTMGQRLIRRLCSECKKESKLEESDLKKIKESMEALKGHVPFPDINENTKVYSAGSCDACSSTGYKGRIGVFEVFSITPAIEKLVLDRPTMSAIRELAVSEGMTTMLQDGYLKLLEGLTSISEIRGVLG